MNRVRIILITLIVLLSAWGIARFLQLYFGENTHELPQQWVKLAGENIAVEHSGNSLRLRPGALLRIDPSVVETQTYRLQIQAEVIAFKGFDYGLVTAEGEQAVSVGEQQNRWLFLAPGKVVSLELLIDGTQVKAIADAIAHEGPALVEIISDVELT